MVNTIALCYGELKNNLSVQNIIYSYFLSEPKIKHQDNEHLNNSPSMDLMEGSILYLGVPDCFDVKSSGGTVKCTMGLKHN